MKLPWSLALGTLVLSTPLFAQTLTQVRVSSNQAPELAESYEAKGYDLLEGSVAANSFDLVVTDAELESLQSAGLNFEVILVGRPFYDIQQAAAGSEDVPVAGYSDYSAIVSQMQAVAAAAPAICQFVNLTAVYGMPATSGGRNLFALKISDNVALEEDEPSFLMVSVHHAREIVTPVIALDAATRLTTNYGSDPTITALVDDNEIWIAPVWNPDGYNFVFTNNCLWRKNRTPVGGGNRGVDTNRNYPLGWSSVCAGSTSPGSSTYKGPSVASEVETQTMMVWSNDQRFSKVLDYHSSGRETLWGYRCSSHPLSSYQQSQAVTLSNMSGYGGSNRPPSAEGEHYEWQLADRGAFSFLTEVSTTFQPSFASAQAEAATVWPGTIWMLQRPSVFSGHVTDSTNGQPLAADIDITGIVFSNGEQYTSGGDFGRYDLFIPNGSYTASFSAPGFVVQNFNFSVVGGVGTTIDVSLVPLAPTMASTTFRNGTGINPACLMSLSAPLIGSSWQIQVDATPFPGAAFTVVQARQFPDPGTIFGFGEVLMNLGSTLLFSLEGPIVGGQTLNNAMIPNDPSLAGFTLTIQAGVIGGGSILGLCNAEDVVVGTF